VRRVILRLVLAAAAAALLVAGLAGAYSYGQSYSLHRGFVRLAPLKYAGQGRFLDVNFYSRALHRRAFYLVYLPPGYSPLRRYPTFYLLHGMPGRPQAYVDIGNIDVRLDDLLGLHRLRPMILVFPDGRVGGNTYSDSEWANTPTGNYDSFVVDVVRDVDQRFAALPFRQDRVIGGLSAGAYGAINVALHHLDIFSSVQVWSGYFVQTRSGVFARASPALLRDNSPLDYVGRLRRRFAANPTRVFMFVGRRDPASRQIAPMALALRTAGAHVRDAIYPGGHDWGEWYPRLNQLLVLASHDVSHPLRTRLRQHLHRHHLPGQAGFRPQPRARPAVGHAAGTRVRSPSRRYELILGLFLALISAAAINLGFMLQQKGLRELAGRSLLMAFRIRMWLLGQAVGWLGMAAQIVAVAIAPLSLVQAFAVGGLALSVPIAAGVFGYRVQRRQARAVLVIALALALLSLGLPPAHDHTVAGLLIGEVALAAVAAATCARSTRTELRAISSGISYGVADAAIKAVAVDWHVHGSGALLSVWTLLAIIATFCGFLAFQSALRGGSAVSAISIMTALATVTAIAFGLVSFGESLGADFGAVVLHLAAILVALGCLPLVVGAQAEVAAAEALAGPSARAKRVLRAAGLAGAFLAGALILLASMLAGFGLLYRLRGLHWGNAGLPIGDSLPLLQLAGFASQPLARIAAAWLLAGVVFGLALIRVRPLRRAAVAATLGTLLLLFASDAAFALARNLRLADVLSTRDPGTGPWWEGMLFALGAWLPHSLPRRRWAHEAAEPRPAGHRLASIFAQLAARTEGR
jgi:enterochelin esterase-like enzyme